MPLLSRRKFLSFALATAASSVIPFESAAEARDFFANERTLTLQNLHTGEKLNVMYQERGVYLAQALKEINYILRDHRTGEIEPIDIRLLDLLYSLQNRLETSGTIHVISGYRSPETNRLLNQQSNGVAKKSLHMKGKAVDIRMPGVDLRFLKKAAVSMGRGGVGYYPSSAFVHVDTGPVRYW